MPAVTRSLMSDDSSSAMAPMMVNMARPIGLSVSTWSWTLTKRTPRMVELLQRRQQVARAAGEAVELPHQHAVDLLVARGHHQGVELRPALPAA